MIRFITLATAGNGYLNFMGNEFGHPEWIDFPRQGNAWSYQYARRQWSLVDNPGLKYQYLGTFDKAMIQLAKQAALLEQPHIHLLCEHSDDKILVFDRAGLIFAFNFHPTQSYTDYHVAAAAGRYRMLLDSDADAFGGHGRLAPDQEQVAPANASSSTDRSCLRLYLPNRTVIVLGKG
jgi:1,4-alpha-glucan branching enzyme